ncbi:hypothetical protein NDN08_004575 [Rhodosorus marinus]|uniref:Reverse transcriptase Ty1/copia-type domain-containing protein n=1 Tax=Rhodosorus marinus TaxID=101924 RepID=A0AAV8ULU1_9RHOD|nr:hypothetical protein NDN08_004575 [Rhodosorus marinus]
MDSCAFLNGHVLILLYVDDLIITGPEDEIRKAESVLKSLYETRELGGIVSYLGVQFERNFGDSIMLMHQKPCVDKLLTKYGLEENILSAVRALAMRMHIPKREDWVVARRILKYFFEGHTRVLVWSSA